MRRVSQSTLYSPDAIGNGDCFTACLACLLDLPLWMVPPFHQMYGRSDHRERVDEWLGRMFHAQLVKTHGHEIDKMPEFYIANGPAARGSHHSVIYSGGELAFDPHPSSMGIREVEWTWHLSVKATDATAATERQNTLKLPPIEGK